MGWDNSVVELGVVVTVELGTLLLHSGVVKKALVFHLLPLLVLLN